ncbi:SUMF1/EgtB/PvdO family nonheme iron enzyme [Sorangium sp. So ce134]
MVARASLEGAAVAVVDRPIKAKESALATVKDSTAIASMMEPAAGAAPVSSSTTSTRCPAEMALVEDRVCVDRWEGSLVELTPGGERPWSPFEPIDGNERRVRAVSWPGVIPQGYISGLQAKRACAASGKRLCTSEEWVSACRGPEATLFPYGASREHGVCNDDERPVHPVAEIAALLGIKSEEHWTTAMNNPLINQLSHALLPTGERAACTNGYGVFDMVGNLHEWVDDPSGTFRGGYFMDTTRNGEGCKYATTAHSFGYHDYSTGFRCCMDPEQAD